MNLNERERIEETTEIDVSSANLIDDFYPRYSSVGIYRHTSM